MEYGFSLLDWLLNPLALVWFSMPLGECFPLLTIEIVSDSTLPLSIAKPLRPNVYLAAAKIGASPYLSLMFTISS